MMTGLPKTNIPWATHTWSPIRGCVEDGVCAVAARCWAKALCWRFSHSTNPKVAAQFEGLIEKKWPVLLPGQDRASWKPELYWSSVRTYPEAFDLRFPRDPAVIFVAPMGDLALTDAETVRRVFGQAICETDHQVIFLTKRPGLLLEKLRTGRTRTGVAMVGAEQLVLTEALEHGRVEFLSHLYLGVSCSTQADFDERVSVLCEQWPGPKWVSLEPQSEAIDVSRHVFRREGYMGEEKLALLVDWIVQGCESGKDRRPFEVEWARTTRDQCAEAGVPYWLKQTDGPICGVRDTFNLTSFCRRDKGSCVTCGRSFKGRRKVVEAPLLDGRRHLDAPPAIAAILQKRGKTT